MLLCNTHLNIQTSYVLVTLRHIHSNADLRCCNSTWKLAYYDKICVPRQPGKGGEGFLPAILTSAITKKSKFSSVCFWTVGKVLWMTCLKRNTVIFISTIPDVSNKTSQVDILIIWIDAKTITATKYACYKLRYQIHWFTGLSVSPEMTSIF